MHGLRWDVAVIAELPDEISRGNIADLSIFADDPALALINPRFLEIGSLHGRLWATPFLAAPHGVFINRELAETQNLDVPPVDWNLAQYIDFVSNSRADQFFGQEGIQFTDNALFSSITQDFHYSLAFRDPGDPFVNMDSAAMRDIHRGMPQMANHALNTGTALGLATPGWVSGRSAWAMFAQGTLLTHSSSPAMIQNAGSATHTNRVQIHDWDLYPRPSSDWVPTHAGTNVMMMTLHNFAMDDGDPTLSQEEFDRMRLAWEFMRFYTLDIRSWTAKTNYTFGADGHSGLDYTLPFVTGQLYWDKLDLHFDAVQRQIFADPDRFPGFHYVLNLWDEGRHWGWGNNVYPMMMTIEGQNRHITQEWNQRGAGVTDAHWLDQLFVNLPVWDDLFNDRWTTRFAQLEEVLERFYPTVHSMSEFN
jgi:hypothetical protein